MIITSDSELQNLVDRAAPLGAVSNDFSSSYFSEIFLDIYFSTY